MQKRVSESSSSFFVCDRSFGRGIKKSGTDWLHFFIVCRVRLVFVDRFFGYKNVQESSD